MKEQETEFGIVKDNKVYLKAWGQVPEREIGEVRDDNPAESLKYFEDKFAELEQKISDLETIIGDSANKGSYLMKLLHLKDLLHTHDGIGNYLQLEERLTRQESLLQDIISKNRTRNSEIKKALVEEVKAAADKINWKEATEDIHDIKGRWIKTGNAAEEENQELEEQFWGIVSAFFEKKKTFYEDKKRLGAKNKEEYEALVKEASELRNLHGKERFEKVKSLKNRWKEVGSVPKEDYAPLVDEFNKYLKPNNKKPFSPQVDLNAIEEVVNESLKSGKIDGRRLDAIRNELKPYRPTEFKAKARRKEIFKKIQMLKEWSFVGNMAAKRNQGFSDKSSDEKRQLEIRVLKEFLSRDQEDLDKYLENSANFSTASGQLNPMVEKQLKQQQSKVAIKRELLEFLQKQ